MLIDPSESTLLIVDIQEKLFSKIENSKSLLSVVERALLVFKVMGTPIVYSEQYPKGLGLTISSLRENLSNTKSVKIEKTSFACFSKEDKIIKAQDFIKSKQVIICGIETHICILQTAINLKKLGYEVFVLEDGVGSRKKRDRDLAFVRLNKNGVYLITLEMLVFEMLRDSKHEHFKQLSDIIK